MTALPSLGSSAVEAHDGGVFQTPGFGWMVVSVYRICIPIQSKLWGDGGRGLSPVGRLQPKLFHHSTPCSREQGSGKILVGSHR